MTIQLEMGASRISVFAEANISSRAFDSAKAAWYRRMADEAMRGERTLHQRYAELLAAFRREFSQRALPGEVGERREVPAPFQARLSPLASEYRSVTIDNAALSPISAVAAFEAPSHSPEAGAFGVSDEDDGIDTVVLTEREAQAARNPLPFAHAGNSPVASAAIDEALRLDIARYAAIGAELAVFPEAAAMILERNGISDIAAWAQLDLSFRARLRDPQANDAWLEQYRFYHAHFSAEARKRGR